MSNALLSSEDVDSCLERIFAQKNSRPPAMSAVSPVTLTETKVRKLTDQVRMLLLSQPALLELEAPVNVLGDIHGQYLDLLRFFELAGYPPNCNYLFLGDYIDRGRQSLEVMCLLMCYKIKYPENFFMLRGNHECASITRIYGFYDDCKRRYNLKTWKVFCDMFNCFPLGATIDDKILCVHGGISPEIGKDLEVIKRIVRPTDVPDAGLLTDLLWADPEKKIFGWIESDRGVSYVFEVRRRCSSIRI